jgi:hypothetical protein
VKSIAEAMSMATSAMTVDDALFDVGPGVTTQDISLEIG